MDLNPYIKELRKEHARVVEAIRALEAIISAKEAAGEPVKRGRGRPLKISTRYELEDTAVSPPKVNELKRSS